MHNKILKWLSIIGQKFGISEVWHVWRDDDSARRIKEFFVYELVSSEPLDRQHIPVTTSQDADITYEIVKGWQNRFLISCHSERGLYILQALEASRYVPNFMDSIFGENIKNFGCGAIQPLPWVDMSDKKNVFQMEVVFNEFVTCVFEEKNFKVTKIEVTGITDFNGIETEHRVVVPEYEIEIPEEEEEEFLDPGSV